LSAVVIFTAVSALTFLTACEKKEEAAKSTTVLAKPTSIDQQVDNVAKEVKETPAAYQDFLQQMIDVACRNNPGLALQVEQYATEEAKQQITELVKDARKASAATKQYEDQLKTKAQSANLLGQQLADLRQENARLGEAKNVNVKKIDDQGAEIASLTSKVSGLQTQLANAKKWDDKTQGLFATEPLHDKDNNKGSVVYRPVYCLPSSGKLLKN